MKTANEFVIEVRQVENDTDAIKIIQEIQKDATEELRARLTELKLLLVLEQHRNCDLEGTPESNVPSNQEMISIPKTELEKLQGRLGLMADEFTRIRCLAESHQKTILGICSRALEDIRETVPLIVQRDNETKRANAAEKTVVYLEKQCAAMREAFSWILANLQRCGTPIQVIDGILNLCERMLSPTPAKTTYHPSR